MISDKPNYNFPFPEPPWPEKGNMTSHFIVPTAVFDLIVDGELQDTVEAPSRSDAHRMFAERKPEYSTLAYQGRVKVPAREHGHWPAAGCIGVCVFCQVPIEQVGREYKEKQS